MAIEKKNKMRARRKATRVRWRLKRENQELPRVSVFRSLKHVYAQIINDATHATVASCSSLELKTASGDKTTVAHSIGLELAKRAKEHGIEKAKFDKGQFRYHGRIQALADGLREGGLKI